MVIFIMIVIVNITVKNIHFTTAQGFLLLSLVLISFKDKDSLCSQAGLEHIVLLPPASASRMLAFQAHVATPGCFLCGAANMLVYSGQHAAFPQT